MLAVGPVSRETDVVAFLGPSLPVDEAARIIPGARFEPPVSRGDLARARKQGASVLLVIDGQFHHHEALPVREVVDVARDGAAVYGAASMGALRAAECWPVGVRGVGLVYRWFRSGCLESDDEVAVTTDPDDGFRALSVPLVNFRAAAARAVRRRLIDRRAGGALVEEARRLFYAERTWPAVLEATGHSAGSGLAKFCADIDVKRDDARKLLTTVAAALSADRGTVEQHEPRARAVLAEKARQPLPAPVADASSATHAPDLARWMVGTGRFGSDRQPGMFTPFGVWTRLAVDTPQFTAWLWNDLASRGELEAELMRMQAVEEAEREAVRRRLQARSFDHYLARTEIAARYGCTSWERVRQVAKARGVPWGWVDAGARRLAVGKRVREALFDAG